jgi:hypothetical protein
MKLLATCTGIAPGSWALLHDRERDSPRWRALVLVRPIEAHAQTDRGTTAQYFFRWNSDRLSATPDFLRLRQHFPLVLDWLNETMPTVTWWEESVSGTTPGKATAAGSGR